MDTIQLKTSLREYVSGRASAVLRTSQFFQYWRSPNVTAETAEGFLGAYHQLVECFPPLVAFAAARADEDARIVLATNLFQECGEGDPSRTHLAIFRKYMRTAGVGLRPHPDSLAIRWSDALWESIEKSDELGTILGIVAAGEFLAQPALSHILGPLAAVFPKADEEYFTTHLAQEQLHVEGMLDLMAKEATKRDSEATVRMGVDMGMNIWKQWFDAIHDRLVGQRVPPRQQGLIRFSKPVGETLAPPKP